MSAPSGTVVLGFGPQPLTWLSSASKLCGKNAIVYPRIATMSGATMAVEPLFREKMASASPEWAALMPIWDELCALDDAKDSDSVYAGIKTAISGARAAQTQHP